MSTQNPRFTGKRPPGLGTFRAATLRPMVPDVPPVQAAMQRTGALGSLLARLKTSQACLDVVKAQLPASMADQVNAGPVDDDGWTLLVTNAAVSAKLRQMQPLLIEALARKGLKVSAIRIKVQRS